VAGHILVMDDDEMILNATMALIDILGYTVDTATEGKEALEKYKTAEKNGKVFDVVIMDLTIPGGMGGLETLKELIAFDSTAKVIVSSGYSTDPIMVDYTDYGFKDRLVKPFQMDDLKEVLSLHIIDE
jgi:two-component system cell cycle sensor histidine kinase/response regulator CckA